MYAELQIEKVFGRMAVMFHHFPMKKNATIFLAHGATTNHHLASLLHTWRIIPLSSFIFTSIVYSNVFKLEKRKTHGKSKNKTSKLKKRSKINGKRNVKKGEKNVKNGLVHLHLCCFFVFRFVFFCFYFFCLEKNKTNRKTKIKKCKWTSPHFSHFLSFCLSWFPIVSFYFVFVFFGFC